MRLSNGAEIDCQGTPVRFDGQEAVVTWFWTYDCDGKEIDDGKTSTVTFAWKPIAPREFDVDFVGSTGHPPTTEMVAMLEDYVLSEIPDHLDAVARDW